MMETAFGPIDDSQKIWGRVWEKYPSSGHIRVLKDPCTPDPTDEPAAATLDILLTNGRTVEIESSTITALESDFTNIGQTVFENLAGSASAQQTITLDSGKTRDDIANIQIETYWIDFEYSNYGTPYDGSDPFED